MAGTLSRTATPRGLGLPEVGSPSHGPGACVGGGAAERAIAVFLDNEQWFARLTERLLGFFTPERCSTILSDADFGLVLRPFAGLHAAVTTIAGLGALTVDVNTFVNALAAHASLITVCCSRSKFWRKK